MKKLIMAFGLSLASGIALAQTEGQTLGQPEAGGKAQKAARMKQQLGLSEEQVAKMRELRDAGASKEEMRAVLTPEQQAKAAELKQKHGKGRAEKMNNNLDLSQEQREKMKEIRDSGGSREDMRAVLTPEQQAKMDQGRGQHQGQDRQAEE